MATKRKPPAPAAPARFEREIEIDGGNARVTAPRNSGEVFFSVRVRDGVGFRSYAVVLSGDEARSLGVALRDGADVSEGVD